MFWKILIFSIITIYLADTIFGKNLVNIYECWGIFGKPGGGKTTLLCKFGYQHLKKGWKVQADFGTNISGIERFNDDDIKKATKLPDGRKGFPEWYNAAYFDIDDWKDMDDQLKQFHISENHCGPINENDVNICQMWDEIGTSYNNREFKTNFTNAASLRFWKEHRHRHVKIIYCSQFYKDMDSKIRPLTDRYFICKRSFLNCISYAKPILTDIDITNSENSDNAGGQIIDIFRYGFITSWQFILLPRWIHKFNSFA